MKEDAIYWAYIFPALVLVVVGADIQFNVTNVRVPCNQQLSDYSLILAQMYVMSSLPPNQQSIAGGIFNTVSKLCNNLGLGIATSVSSSIAGQMTATTPAIRPYLAVYWFSAACAGLSVFMVPFLTLGTQGGDTSSNDARTVVASDNEGDTGEKRAVDDSITGADTRVATPVTELEKS
jgi:hypothetical protein